MKKLSSIKNITEICFDKYQSWCVGMWTGKENHEYTLHDDFVMCTGLPGETGEVLELLKKAERDQKDITLVDKKKLIKELGDVNYYLNVIANRHGITMSDVVNANVKKLNARYAKKRR